MSVDRYLPAHVDPTRITHRIGLISDTHMPLRCRVLPPTLHDVLAGVDLLLHAGDVGELWVLDRLSAIAPLVAVHGNDDTPAAHRELPFQQLITLGGQRLLLDYSHSGPGGRAAGEGGASQLQQDWICDMCSAVNFAR